MGVMYVFLLFDGCPSEGDAHGADEWAPIGMLVGFAKICDLMAMDVCGVG